ncbi:MAG: VCBS repeat-containing protein [Myxococcales bacterium]|nr:VCBS repeat-containing protein [Myxococcales bacterium]
MHSHLRRAGATIALTSALALACGDADATSDSDAASGSTSVATTQASAGPSTGAGSSSDAGGPSTGGTNGATSSGTSAGPTGPTEVTDTDDAKFDVAAEDVPEDTGDQPSCTVSRGELDAVPPCDIETPPDSFEPIVQWEWWGDGAHTNSLTTPLVANLTDDNDDGQIDLCDTPDLLIYAHVGLTGDPERMFVLDGATGAVHWDYDGGFRFSQVPAIGDLDGDGLPEIVAVTTPGQLMALAHDGAIKWQVAAPWAASMSPAIALADLDADGDVEIIIGSSVADHQGALLWTADEPLNFYHTTTAADLDDDGDLEVVVGRSAYHHDGTPLFINAQLGPGHAHVANLDDDPEPEILMTGQAGISILEHDGTPKYVNQTPTGDPPSNNNWRRPAAVLDVDGDGLAEFAMSSATTYAVYRDDLSILWSAPVADLTGSAAGTAFDFLGDGEAEAMYGDETQLFVYDGAGAPLLTVPRGSRTTTEYPVVADVDNDGSAEIVVVSESDQNNTPTVQVIREARDRWIPARRIWNQHAYHVTNVREDATIPQVQPRSWELLNTFRTQAQVEEGVCKPAPPE